MIRASSVRKGFKNLWVAGLSAIAVLSVAVAATPGFPFTEDFTNASLSDAGATTADWGATTPGILQFGFATNLTAMTLSRSFLGDVEQSLSSRDIVIGDINGDGFPDVVVGNEGLRGNFGLVGAANLIYFNTAGSFNTPPVEVDPGDTSVTRGMAIGDLDNDGDLDLVSGNFQEPATYNLNDGSGTFAPAVAFTNQARNTWRSALIDVDGDGDLDYIETNSNGVNSLYENLFIDNGGTGVEFAPERRITPDSFDTRSLALGDIDNDGDTDMIAGDLGTGNHIYRWFNGDFTDRGVVHSNSNATFSLSLADLNGDGYLDLVEGNGGAATQIYFNQGVANPGFFSNPTPLADSNSLHTTVALITRDFDRDGDIDIVEGNNGAWDDDNNPATDLAPMPVRLFLNDGSGSFANGLDFTPAEIQKIYGAAAADVDNDGRLDFVTSHSTNNPGGPQALSSNALYMNGGTVGANSIRQLDSVAASIEVDGANDAIPTARLTVSKVQPAVQADLKFFMSNDGTLFVPVTPDVPVAFPNAGGNQLFWKVDMLTRSANAAQLAQVSQIDIEANRRPNFLGGPDQSGVEGQEDAIDVSAYFSDPDGDALTYQVSGLPTDTGLSLDAKSGLLSGVYTNADAVASPITLNMAAFDGAQSRSGSIQLTVTQAVNDPPTANDDTVPAIDEGGAIAGTFNVLDNDTDPESEALTAMLVDPPLNSSLFELRPDGTFDYTHNGSETTADSFTYRAADAANQSNVATVSLTINLVNDAPVISLVGNATVSVTVGDSFTDPGAEAVDEEDGDLSGNIVVGGDTVDTNTVGTYVITYDVMDSQGLAATQVTRTVNVITGSAPVITLNGDSAITLTVGDTYTDPGFTATDAEDGDLTSQVVVGGDTVDPDTVGTYVVTYNVTDSNGNAAAEVTRTVNVVTDSAPVITLVGPATVNLTVGDSYTDQGATATDAEDGDISAEIVIGGDAVNTAAAGTYVITYNVTDSDGNAAAEVTRTVVVSPAAPPPPPPSGGGGGGLTGIWEVVGLMFAGLIGYRRRRAARTIG